MKNLFIHQLLNQYDTKISQKTKLREVLQQAALYGLKRAGFFEKAAFYGGTALRILYGLNRFSEDLDFTLLDKDPKFDFSTYLMGMKQELISMGLNFEVEKKIKSIDTPIQSAFLKMNTIELLLTIGEEEQLKKTNHNQKIQIKLEIDTDPPSSFTFEEKLVLNPSPFYVLTLTPPSLFAGKVHAILCRSWKGRVKGRDYFDFIWYITQKTSLDLNYLNGALKQTGFLRDNETMNRDRLIQKLKEKFQSIDWQDAKNDVRPFIVDTSVLDIWSPVFFSNLSDHLLTVS
ncbi:MAG: nucleotidyl transferase AbiEii/AbiGii toxin family protein [Chlamydiae bacterium]|jgi:predicted nucleotidyltransferase component of viral defense system|nr:nucleotidyl transferase AbiEii/AbiGii toxin family protein [Chlamydiota bacterium]